MKSCCTVPLGIFLLADGKPYVLFTTFWTCTHVRCYATSGLGVGVGCNNIFELEHMSMLRNIWACTHVRCYATSGLAHMVVATQHHGLGWGGWGVGGGGDDDVLWACTHVGCYGTADVLQGLHTCWMLRNCWCYLGLHTCWMLRNCWCSSGLAHMLDATELLMFFRFAHMLDATELLMFFRACTHVGCYGTADVL